MIDEHSREDELMVQIIGLQGKIERLEKDKLVEVIDALCDRFEKKHDKMLNPELLNYIPEEEDQSL